MADDVDSEVYCWRRSEFFWRMRATLGFTQVWRARKPPPCALRLPATLVGHATDIKPPPFPTFVYASTGSSLFFSVSLFFLLALARVALTLRSLRLDTPRLCRFAVPVFQYKYKPTFSRSKLSHRHLSSHGYNKHLEGVLRALSWAQQTRWITVTVKWEHSWRHLTTRELPAPAAAFALPMAPSHAAATSANR